MSKKALNTDLLREIRKTRSRFFSILMLVVIAVSFLFGLRMAAPDMKASMDAYLDNQKLMDVHILSTLGLTDDDLQALKAEPGTREVEGFYTVDAIATGGREKESLTVKLLSLGESEINCPALTSGRLPEGEGECLVEQNFLDTLHLELGDTITLDTGTGRYEDTLRQSEFTIVGTGISPLYVSLTRGSSSLGSGSVNSVLVLPSEAYDMDYYTDLYLLVEQAEALNAYDDAYEEQIDGYIDRLDTLRAERELARTQQVRGDAQAELDGAWQEYRDAEQEADEKLGDARQELEDARQELDDGWQEYEDGQQELTDAAVKIEDGQRELDDAYGKLKDGERDYKSGKQEYEKGKRDYESGLALYEDGYSQYEAAVAEYETGLAAYEAGLAQYQQGEQAYADGLARYEQGEQAYADGLAKYEAGEAAYAEGLAQYEQGEQAYADGLAQYEQGKAAYESGLAQYEQGLAQYEQGLAQYEQGYAQWQAGQAQLDGQLQQLLDAGYDEDTARAMVADGQAQLDRAKAELEQSKATLDATKSALASAKAELEGAKAQLEQSEAQLSESRAELDGAKAQLEASRVELDGAKQELTQSRKVLDETKQTLAQSRGQLDETKQLLAGTKAQLDEGKALLESNGGDLAKALAVLQASESKLKSAQSQLTCARKELDQGWKDYESGRQDLEQARADYADGEQELADAYQELTDGEQEYADGLVEYADAEAEAEEKLADARVELDDAQQKIDEIEDAEWYVLDRGANIGFASYQQDAERMGRLAALFPTVFFLVAALVCLTSMTRMVEEQRVQIGGLKALGYSKLDIARKYVGYGLLASLIGGVIGLVLGGLGIPWVIVTCWKVMYEYPGVTLTFHWGTALVCLLAAVACCTLAVLAATLAALRETPAALMRPRAPEPGKRVWLEYLPFVWKRLSFTQKVTVRNLFRYKKRFFMTVIGIAGCTGLMITGFGLRDSIMDVVDLQYDEISTYSAVLYTDEDATQEEQEQILQTLEQEPAIKQYAFGYFSNVTLESDHYTLSGNLLCVEEPESLEGFWHFRNRLTKAPVELTHSGALISEKTADLLQVGVGDTVTVVEDDLRAQVNITGIVENYVQHYVYLSKDAYEQAFGSRPEDTQAILAYDEQADWEGLGGRLLKLEGVSGIYYLSDTREMIRNQLNGVYPAVIIIIAAAAALAFVVLYNLSSINITERIRELATLKVLGFRDRETRDYVFRENIVLTLIGMLCGLGAGTLFHRYLITTVEVELVMFGRSAHPLSYVLALVLTVVFSLLVNLVAGNRLKQIDMVESLKTVE